MNAILFLDLENTIINDWTFRRFMVHNLMTIRTAIVVYNEKNPQCPIVSLGLFSYAIHDDVDFKVFQEELQGRIESALNLKFDLRYCMTVAQIKKIFTRLARVVFREPSDTMDFLGDKAFTFFKVVPSILNDAVTRVFLVDDIVGHLDLHRLKTGVVMSTRLIESDLTL